MIDAMVDCTGCFAATPARIPARAGGNGMREGVYDVLPRLFGVERGDHCAWSAGDIYGYIPGFPRSLGGGGRDDVPTHRTCTAYLCQAHGLMQSLDGAIARCIVPSIVCATLRVDRPTMIRSVEKAYHCLCPACRMFHSLISSRWMLSRDVCHGY